MISHSFACKRGQEPEIKEETHCRNLQAQELRESENGCVRVRTKVCERVSVCVRAPVFLFVGYIVWLWVGGGVLGAEYLPMLLISVHPPVVFLLRLWVSVFAK